MSFLVRQISQTADGRDIIRPVTIDKSVLRIGRSAENDIHLQDLAVAPEHATITLSDSRRISVVALGTLGFDLDGRSVTQADIDSFKGAELRFGGHRITVSQDETGIAVLTVQRVEALSEASEDKDEAAVFSLRGLMPGKRVTAWTLALVTLVAFLAVPIWSYATRPDDTRNIYTVAGDGAWSSGPLSQAHHALEGKCETCHQKAFVSVQDSACATCHKDVHDHAPPVRLTGAREEPGMGGVILASVAQTFGKPPEGACVDCHTEHEGAGPMQPVAQQFCTDCHGSLNTRLTDTKLGNARDFGKDHPQFRPAITVQPGPHPQFTRVSLDDKPAENTGLKFPHKLHLSRTNGVAKMARTLKVQQGYGDALACKDCHTPTPDGVRFQPVDMETDCAACHSLGFESVGGTVRTLRHGEPAQVIADLRAYYRSTPPSQPAQLGGMVRRRPGQYAQGQVYSAYFGAVATRPSRAEDAIRAVFSKGGACYDCHTITPPGVNGAASWTVMPVHQPMRYMANGWFDHDAHKTETCSSCHKAGASTTSADVLLPDLASCQTCHGGEKASADVPSGCVLCHSYHADDGAPWLTRKRIAAAKSP